MIKCRAASLAGDPPHDAEYWRYPMQSDDTIVSIPLLARDGSLVGHTLVDAADADWVNQWSWHLMRTPDGRMYAHRAIRTGDRVLTVRLHREIMGFGRVGDPRKVDHLSRDGLDNRRQNLRVATDAQNMQNKRVYRNNTSGYRGVSWRSDSQRWFAYGRLDGTLHRLGLYDTAEEAGAVASAWRIEHMPYTIET